MKPIFLIGLPGCGKSTLGRALARKLQCDFFDLDNYIVSRFRCTIPDMFAQAGEQEFRRRESVMLREVGEMENVVIACGGGTPCHHDNMEYMLSRGTTVWLQASMPVLMRRIIRAKSRRPMFAACADDAAIRERVDALIEQRTPYYSLARHSFDADELESVQMIESSVNRFLEQLQIQP